MKADEKTTKVFNEFLSRHRAFETRWGPIEKKIEYFLSLSQQGSGRINEQIQFFFQKANTHTHLLSAEEAEFMPPFIAEVTKYLKEFAQFHSAYREYCRHISKYYKAQQKILESVNDENISKETWHLLYVQREFLGDLEEELKNIHVNFNVISTRFKRLWQKFQNAGYAEEG